jgi:CubicO group peptidase (beta-lactamase class C family)
MKKIFYYTLLGLIAALAGILIAGCRAAPPASQPSTTPVQLTKTSPSPTDTPTPEPTATPLPTIAAYEIIPESINDGWETGSLASVDINPVIISDMLNHIYQGEYSTDSIFHENGSVKYEGIHSIIIVKDGKLVFEEYFNLNEREFKHDTHSVTKSVTSLLVGLAIEHGFLQSTDVKVFSYFTDYMPIFNWDENKASITVENLLTMSSGMDCDDADPNSKGQQWKMYPTEDWLEFFISLPSVRSPGKAFAYCSGGVIALGGVLERATGMSISDFSEQYLFEPMGIHDFTWIKYQWGTSTSGALLMRPRDMAKLGQMMLDGGQWNGEQIVPRDWVRASRAKQIELKFKSREWFDEYGYLWWRGNLEIQGSIYQPYVAWGMGGQLIIIFPKEDMVIVFTTGNEKGDGNIPLRITEKYILPAILEGAP